MKLTYDEISPISGNKSILVEYDEGIGWMKICMDTGYSTQEEWIDGSPQCEAFEFACPEHIKNTKFVDLTGQVWYKLTLCSGDVMLYSDVYDGDPMWFVGKWRDLYIDELLSDKYMIRYEKNIIGGEIARVFDNKYAMIFEDTNFADAYNNFNKLVNEELAHN